MEASETSNIISSAVTATENEIKDRMAKFADDYFEYKPLNSSVIDSYNNMVEVELENILSKPIFVETKKGQAYQVYFTHIIRLPPFKGKLGKEDDKKPAQYVNKRENYDPTELNEELFNNLNAERLSDVSGENDIERYKPHRSWLLASEARRDEMTWYLSIYADVTIVTRYEPNANKERAYAELPKIVDDVYEDEDGFINEDDDYDIIAADVFKSTDEYKTLTKQQVTTFEFVKLFQIPLMVGSKWDWMMIAQVPTRAYSLYGECDTNSLGYFVVKSEKFFVTQEKLQPNIHRCTVKDNTYTADLRSETQDRRSMIIKLHTFEDKNANFCAVELRFLQKKDPLKLDFNILLVFRLYILIWNHFNEDHVFDDSITAMFGEFNKYLLLIVKNQDSYKQIVRYLLDTIHNAKRSFPNDNNFIKDIRYRMNLPESVDESVVIARVKLLLENELFPHVKADEYAPAIEDYEWTPYPKLLLLVEMLVKYIKCTRGFKALDNRDHSGTKQLAMIGNELGSLVEKAFRNVHRKIQLKLSGDNDSINLSFINEISKWGEHEVTEKIKSCFSTGKWGISKTHTRAGVVQQFEQGISLRMASIRKVSIPISKQAKIKEPRLVEDSAYAVLDSTNTPDSEQVGLVKQLAVSVVVTTDDQTSLGIWNDLIDEFFTNGKITWTKSENNQMLYINNIPKGFITNEVFNEIHNVKRPRNQDQQPLCIYSEVYQKVEVDSIETVRSYHIDTSAGRPMRPVFVLEFRDGQNVFLALERGLLFTKNVKFFDLVLGGVVEFISPNEFESNKLTITYDDFIAENRKPTPRQLNYMEIDPIYQFGVGIASGILNNKMPNPRVIYFAQMLNQAIGVPLATFQGRHDTDLKVLHYPQKPLVSSDMINRMQLDQQPSGSNVTIFVLSAAYNDEDATIWNQTAFERGLFQATLFETYKDEGSLPLVSEGDDIRIMQDGVIKVRYGTVNASKGLPEDEEKQENDDEDNDNDEEFDVRDLDFQRQTDHERKGKNKESVEEEHGNLADMLKSKIPIGSFKHIGKITGRTNIYVEPKTPLFKTQTGKSDKINTIMVGGNRAGYVHSSHRTPNGSRVSQKVTVRYPHIPGEGDKMATRQAQKGVVGKVYRQEDMPYALGSTGESIVPDVIFSPTSFGSRMTASMFAEILIGNAAIVCDTTLQVKNLVKIVPGQGVVFTENFSDFYVTLEQVLVLKSTSGSPMKSATQQFKTMKDIRNEVISGTFISLAKKNKKIKDYITENIENSTIDDIIDNNRLDLMELVLKLTNVGNKMDFVQYLERSITKYITDLTTNGDYRKVFGLKFKIHDIYAKQNSFTEQEIINEYINQLETGTHDDNVLANKVYYLQRGSSKEIKEAFKFVAENFKGDNLRSIITRNRGEYTKLLRLKEPLRVPNETKHQIRNLAIQIANLENVVSFVKNIQNSNTIHAIGGKYTYIVPDEKFQATLQSGQKAILFSQLPSKYKIQWVNKNNEKYIPAYRMKDYKEGSFKNRHIDESLIEKLRDGTTFRNDKEMNDISAELQKAGLSYKGTKAVFSSSGIKLEAKVFTGPCYMMSLRHLVESKRQARDEGSKNIETRAPSKALKGEEMTRIANRAHGSTAFLKERLMDAADKFKTNVCTKCGDICYIKPEKHMVGCDRCGSGHADPREITIPYVFVRIQRILMATGINVKFEIGTDNNQDIPDGPLDTRITRLEENDDSESVRKSTGIKRIILPRRKR